MNDSEMMAKAEQDWLPRVELRFLQQDVARRARTLNTERAHKAYNRLWHEIDFHINFPRSGGRNKLAPLMREFLDAMRECDEVVK